MGQLCFSPSFFPNGPPPRQPQKWRQNVYYCGRTKSRRRMISLQSFDSFCWYRGTDYVQQKKQYKVKQTIKSLGELYCLLPAKRSKFFSISTSFQCQKEHRPWKIMALVFFFFFFFQLKFLRQSHERAEINKLRHHGVFSKVVILTDDSLPPISKREITSYCKNTACENNAVVRHLTSHWAQ